MGLNKTADGRYIVGQGVENGNNYHGFNGKRDIVIQLTADGATADGLNALEYLKAYALNAKTENKPIFPDGARVWISTNGYSKAVEADDVVIDGSNITIGGIVWNGSAWDFSNAGQTGGGGTGGGVLVANMTESIDDTAFTVTVSINKTAGELIAAYPLVLLNRITIVDNGEPVVTQMKWACVAEADMSPTESGGVYSFDWYDGEHALTASSLDANPSVTISGK